MTITDELNKFIPNSERYMSSIGKYHLNNDRYKNIYNPLNSGSFIENKFRYKLKYLFYRYLQKKIWGKEIFESSYFKNYQDLCRKQKRLVDFNVIKHAFILQILDKNSLLKGKICSIGDGKANFITGCLNLKNDITLYSTNLPQALLQDYFIIKEFNLLEDKYIKVVNNKADLDIKNIKLFLIPPQNKSFLNNADINLFTNISCFQEIPKGETRDYFDIMKNNKSFLYCCNREEKIMYDEESIKYNEYPFEPCEKIFYEKCFFYQNWYSLRPPFIHKFDGNILHSLVKF